MKNAASGALAVLLAVLWASWAPGGPYSGHYGNPADPNAFDEPIPGFVGPDGYGKALDLGPNNYVNPIFRAWADGYQDYMPTGGVVPGGGWDDPTKALGPVTGEKFDIVSLGDLDSQAIAQGLAPGRITLTFDRPIFNGEGADFAVFENAYVTYEYPSFPGTVFAELGHVEVSSDGQSFARFPSVSLTSEPTGYFAYGTIDSSDVYNLAGKHANAYGESWGTPFDLAGLIDHPLVAAGQVELNNINFVRIIDVPGSGDFVDSQGDPIYDAWPTWGSGGVDLEAVGVVNSLPLGDMNASGAVNNNDISAFVLALTDRDAYVEAYGLAPEAAGDIDGNGELNNNDIAPFVDLLTAPQGVPEPAGVVLLALAAPALMRRRG